jgi:hypothetical protein
MATGEAGKLCARCALAVLQNACRGVKKNFLEHGAHRNRPANDGMSLESEAFVGSFAPARGRRVLIFKRGRWHAK